MSSGYRLLGISLFLENLEDDEHQEILEVVSLVIFFLYKQEGRCYSLGIDSPSKDSQLPAGSWSLHFSFVPWLCGGGTLNYHVLLSHSKNLRATCKPNHRQDLQNQEPKGPFPFMS